MKLSICFCVTLCLGFISTRAQLKTIYTTGGESKVNWDIRVKQTKENEEEYPFLYGSGCTAAPSASKASSTLSSQGSAQYNSSNLHDWDPRTAWVEGKADYGLGEYFEVDLPYGATGVGIFNGYQKSYDAWLNNSRVKKFKVYGDGKPICFLELGDKMGCQEFDIPTTNEFQVYRFEIVDVYPGVKWKDVAVSEITNLGCCFNTNTAILSEGITVSAQDIRVGSVVSSLDIETNEVKVNRVVKSAASTHHRMLRIETSNSFVELTPYHPLYINGYGLMSLYQLNKSKVFNSYDEMINCVEVLVWNEDVQAAEYTRITNLELLEGTFETYSIEKLESGKNYVINGFITAVY